MKRDEAIEKLRLHESELKQLGVQHLYESMQFRGVHYAANVTASLPFAGWKPG